MDGLEDQSEDSEATRLLENVLFTGMPAERSKTEAQALNACRDEEPPTDPSYSDSSNQASLAQYHFHGLAPTQTDSQIDVPADREGSQKENTPASPGKSHVNARASSPRVCATASHKPSSSARPERQRVLPILNVSRSASPLKPSRASSRGRQNPGAAQQSNPTYLSMSPNLAPSSESLSHHAPHAQKIVTRTSGTHAVSFRQLDRGQSPLPPSQDTFQTVPHHEDQDRLVRTAAVVDPGSGIGLAKTTPSRTSAMVFHSPHRRVAPPTPTRVPSASGVLVAATPTNSSPSSSSHDQATQLVYGQLESQESQVGDEAQMSDDIPQAQVVEFELEDMENEGATQITSARDGSTEPSSSYERLLAVNPFEEYSHLQITGQPTQRTSQQSDHESDFSLTQPVTQEYPLDVFSERALARQEQPPAPHRTRHAPSTVTSTTATVGLPGRGLIHPDKRSRYEDAIRAGAARAARNNDHQLASVTSRPPIQDTQPSDVTAANGSATSCLPRTQTIVDVPIPAPQLRDNDDLEVIPDSEPPVPDTSLNPSVPSSTAPPDETKILPSPLRKTRKTKASSDIDQSINIVPETTHEEDEEETDGDDEEDVPLATFTTLSLPSGKKSAAYKHPKGLRATKTAGVKGPNALCATKTPVLKGTAARRAELSHEAPSTRSVMQPPAALGSAKQASDDEMSDLTPVPTEFADDDDYRGPALRATHRSGVKRRRALSGAKKGSAKSTRRGSKAVSTTSTARPSKRLKSSESTFIEDPSCATRVFAVWRVNGYYYSGTIHSLAASSTTRYLVKFDDSTEEVVDVSKMRLCQLAVGDHVVVHDKQKGTVAAYTGSGREDIVEVVIDGGEGLETLEVPMPDVAIPSRTITGDWQNRILDPTTIIPIVRPNDSKVNLAPSKLVSGSAGSLKSSRGPFAKTGFVVTLSAGKDDWEAVKDRVMQSIRDLGGSVIEDWSNIFTLGGTHSNGNKRWQLRREDVQWTKAEDIERVFLLSDAPNQKPKYLMALALGIPCVSVNWLRDVSQEGDNWSHFLLPAGYSEGLDARVSQLVDLDWGNSLNYLTDVMSNSVPPRVLNGGSILCVGSEFFPIPVRAGRRTAAELDKANQASRQVPRILLCMGASVVEAVSDIKHAYHHNLKEYSLVVVKESEDAIRLHRFAPETICVDLPWVKDCLTAGRLFPPPSYEQ